MCPTTRERKLETSKFGSSGPSPLTLLSRYVWRSSPAWNSVVGVNPTQYILCLSDLMIIGMSTGLPIAAATPMYEKHSS